MSAKRAPFQIAVSGKAVYVRIHGLGSMHTAPTIEGFAKRVIKGGARQFVFDLANCTGVDSTFMGMLLGLSKRVTKPDDGKARGCVLINVNDHANKQLSSVGVDAFVSIKEGDTELPKGLKLTELDVVEASDQERMKLMVRAHKDLIAANEKNRAKFGPFLKAIVAELS